MPDFNTIDNSPDAARIQWSEPAQKVPGKAINPNLVKEAYENQASVPQVEHETFQERNVKEIKMGEVEKETRPEEELPEVETKGIIKLREEILETKEAPEQRREELIIREELPEVRKEVESEGARSREALIVRNETPEVRLKEPKPEKVKKRGSFIASLKRVNSLKNSILGFFPADQKK